MQPNDYIIEESLKLVKLIYRLQEGEVLTAEERLQLDGWRQLHEKNEALFQQLQDKHFQAKGVRALQAYAIKDISRALIQTAATIQRELPPVASKTPIRLQHKPVFRWMAAASVVLILAGTYFFFNKQAALVKDQVAKLNDVSPASDKATLTLANGTVVVLDSVANGQLAQQAGASIVKSDGRLAYHGKGDRLLYNTLATPKGGKFQLTLPDGTLVWMNSASSLTYPTSFEKAKERLVTLTGEAYFEVAKNAMQPFRVQVNDLAVKVLGTHFNINGYGDETTIRTTLAEGSVQVSRDGITKLLVPGQQALAVNASRALTVEKANMKQVLSWKNGLFIFDGKDVSEILREMARWYDVEIENKASASKLTYSGVINRNIHLFELLEVLQESGVLHYRIDNSKVIVTP